MRLKERFEQWKKGKFVPSNIDGYEDGQETLGGIGIIRDGEWRQPLLIRLWNILSKFYLKYWQWIIGILVAFSLKAF